MLLLGPTTLSQPQPPPRTKMSPTATQTIEAEVAEATEVTPKEGEPRAKYLARLARAGDKLEEEAWEELSDAAQEWVNAGNEAVNKGEAAPEPDGEHAEAESDDDDDEDEDAEEDGEEDDGEHAEAESDDDDDASDGDDDDDDDDDDATDEPKAEKKEPKVKKPKAEKKPKSEKPAKAEKPAKVKKEKPAKPEKNGRERKHTDEGASDKWRQLVLDNPTVSRDDLAAKFKDSLPEGAKAILYREMRHALRLLGEAGRLKK